MSPNRKTSWLAVGILALVAALPARAAENYLEGLDLFAPPEDRMYDDGPEPAKGWFFGFDGLFWTISAPAQQYIGQDPRVFFRSGVTFDAGATSQLDQSTTTNSFITAKMTTGNRFEFGNFGEENGWIGHVYVLQAQSQDFFDSNVDVVFNDPQGLLTAAQPTRGPGFFSNIPIVFRNIELRDEVNHWSADVSYARRFMVFEKTCEFDLLLGGRYTEVNEVFQLTGYGSAMNSYAQALNTGAVTNSSPTLIQNTINNHILGPQLGGRWAKKSGRWTFATEGHFTAGWNRQNYYQQTQLFNNYVSGFTAFPLQQNGTNTGGVATGTQNNAGQLHSPFADGGTRAAWNDELSPIIDVQLQLKYQLTKAIAARIAFDGTYMGGVARASNTVNWQVGSNVNGTVAGGNPSTTPVLGFDLTHTREDLFLGGVSIGLDINH